MAVSVLDIIFIGVVDPSDDPQLASNQAVIELALGPTLDLGA